MQRDDFTPVLGSEVQELLYNFTQYAFIGGDIKKEALDLKYFPRLVDLLNNADLTQYKIASQPLCVQRLLYELLSQYIFFMTMNTELEFDPDFLDHSSSMTLSSIITKFMVENQWPYPQMLPL